MSVIDMFYTATWHDSYARDYDRGYDRTAASQAPSARWPVNIPRPSGTQPNPILVPATLQRPHDKACTSETADMTAKRHDRLDEPMERNHHTRQGNRLSRV